MDGLFDVSVDIPLEGLDVSELDFGGSGLPPLDYNTMATRLFPPSINVNSLRGLAFNINIEVVSGGEFSFMARFLLDVKNVNAFGLLADVSTTLSNSLNEASDTLGGAIEPFIPGFDSAAEVLTEIASQDNIKVDLDVSIDLTVNLDMSLSTFNITSSLDKLHTAVRANAAGRFSFAIQDLSFDIQPSVKLSLKGNNDAVPFDVFAENSSGNLGSFDFGGSLETMIVIGVEVSVLFFICSDTHHQC